MDKAPLREEEKEESVGFMFSLNSQRREVVVGILKFVRLFPMTRVR